jgi:hypothetical protein
MVNTKLCKLCKLEKPLAAFKPNRHQCRKCLSGRDYARVKASPRLFMQQKEWNRARYKRKTALIAKQRQKLKQKYPERALLWAAKHRSKEHNLPFNLEESDICIPKMCPILNIELKFTKKKSRNTPSIDRIIPDKGYVKGNVKIISLSANRLKNNGTLEQFKNIIKYIEENTLEHSK